MKAYILSIAGVVLLSAVATIIAPSGKMGKFVKGMTKLMTLLVILSPLVSWVSGRKTFTIETSSIQADSAYLTRCAELLERQDEEEIVLWLEDEFSVTATAEVSRAAAVGFAREKIVVKILDFGIIGQDGHINTVSRVRSGLEAKYGCSAEVS